MIQVDPVSTRQGSMDGRVAIVAGACGGIGRVVAQDLARRGAQLALWDTDIRGLEALRAQIPSAVIISADLTDEVAVKQAMEQTVAQCHRVDTLVHCVGVTGPCLPVSDYPLADWQRTLDINLKSAFLCGRAAITPMRAIGYGRIVFLASIAGKEGNADMSAYSVAKAGVIALTKSLGKELANASILVNCVAPAVIETPLNRQMTPEALQASLSKIPMGRPGQPQEVANLIGWLASEECSFSTGACFDLSGGRATY